MADRIFPSRVSEDRLDSELVFKGIDWDNFQVKTAKKEKMPAELLEHFKSLNGDAEGTEDKKDDSKDKEAKASSEKDHVLAALLALAAEDEDDSDDDTEDEDSDDDDDEDVTSNTKTAKKRSCPKCGEKIKTFKKDCVSCGEPNPFYDAKNMSSDDNVESSWKTALKKLSEETEDEDPEETEDEDKRIVKGKEPKMASIIHFTHPSQLSADAVEAALASGDKVLANTILAARHDRRLRLASNIEKVVEAQKAQAVKLAQRKAYRESLVKTASEPAKNVKVAASNGFVKVSEMNNTAKKAFASKAIAAGFPQEYVAAMLNTETVANNDISEIKTVMASDLNSNVKKAAVSGMVKVATLTNADYDRLVDYWVNELGYGDREWVETLFTKKYDK
jgi:hypothetical protein